MGNLNCIEHRQRALLLSAPRTGMTRKAAAPAMATAGFSAHVSPYPNQWQMAFAAGTHACTALAC